MKCSICGQEADLLTVNDDAICEQCAEKAEYVVCARRGKVIADSNFYCDRMCDDCVWKDEK